MSQHPLVLAVQDTTFFNYSHHPHTEGLGEIGNKKQQQRGFGLHSTLVVTPTGLPLGILTQQFFTRPIPRRNYSGCRSKPRRATNGLRPLSKPCS
ncbi:MAG: hypothetical protein AB1801_18480 [Chloroflexota bacterium]